jgi:hypothetical protein
MISDQQVTSQIILQSLLELERQGATATLQRLVEVEPDLASYLMESLSSLHGNLLALGLPARKTQRLYRQVQSLTLVCILALRKGHHELWRNEMGPRLAALESADDEPGPPASEPRPPG